MTRVSVCVFCGSRYGRSGAYREAAEALGRGIARRGWRLVYGGGDVGLMGVVADAVLAEGGEVLGIIPSLLLEREAGKRDVHDLVVTESMHDRKDRMIAASDAFVSLPGGFGTLDELLEVMTLRQLGYIASPILLLDTGGYWRPFLDLIDRVVEEAFAEREAAALVEVAPDAEATLDRIAALLQPAG